MPAYKRENIEDKECIPILEYFNSHGLPTTMCCQGHDTTDRSLFWVSFDISVTEHDIIKFQANHFDHRGAFCACGHFSQRLLATMDRSAPPPEDGSTLLQVLRMWQYAAGTVEAANKDLATWLKMDEENSGPTVEDFWRNLKLPTA